MTSRPSTAAALLAVLAVVLGMLGVYVGGYFWFGERRDVLLGPNPAAPANCVLRTYPHAWQMKVFKPAGKLEAWFRGHAVVLAYDSLGE